MSLTILLDRHGHVYHLGEVLKGAVVVTCKGATTHNGITLQAEGNVTLQLSPRKVGIFEAFNATAKPLQLMNLQLNLAEPGCLPDGRTTIPFEFPVRPTSSKTGLYETYHGVFINVQYFITVEMQRGIFAKTQRESVQFLVINPGQSAGDACRKPISFVLEPHNLRNVKGPQLQQVPRFRIRGQMDSVVCDISKPLSGHICVEHTDMSVSRIELQLVRVEFCATDEGVTKEATEVQNIQVADGDVCRGIDIPLTMVFPRWFTCPTLVTPNFKVEFEVNLVVLFEDKHQLTNNFPLQLYRPLVSNMY